jgi:signal peptidase I
MQEKIKKINLKILSIVGIVLSVSALILSVIVPNSGNEKLNNFDSWAVITVFLAVIYLLVFSILNLFKPRKTLSTIGIILSSLAFVLGIIFIFKPSQSQLPQSKLLDVITNFLFLFSSLFLGIISIVSFIKAPKQQTTKLSLEPEVSPKPETKTKTIFKKVLWIIGALLIGFIITILISGIFVLINPSWEFGWISFSLSGLVTIGGVVIISIISKKIISKKVGRKTAKVFLVIFSFLLILSLVGHFVIQYFFMSNEGLEPYLHKGDYFLIEKFNKSIRKGDIVVTRTRNHFIDSLVIGLPGDKIELKDGTFFVNGEPLKNVSYNFYHVYGMDYNTGDYFIVVPPDSFFGIPTLLEEKFADNEQKMQENQTTSNRFCPYENSYFNPKDNLCYCKEGFIWNKKEGKDVKCVKGINLSVYLYKQSDIIGKVIYPIRTTYYKNP